MSYGSSEDKKPGTTVKVVDVRPTGTGHIDVTARVEYTTKSATTFHAQHTHGTDGHRGTTSVGFSIPLGRGGR